MFLRRVLIGFKKKIDRKKEARAREVREWISFLPGPLKLHASLVAGVGAGRARVREAAHAGAGLAALTDVAAHAGDQPIRACVHRDVADRLLRLVDAVVDRDEGAVGQSPAGVADVPVPERFDGSAGAGCEKEADERQSRDHGEFVLLGGAHGWKLRRS